MLEESFRKFFLTKIAEKDTKHKSSCPEVFCKVHTIKNVAKFKGKYLCQSPLFNKTEA